MNRENEHVGRTRAERRAGWRYTWEFAVGVVLYLLLFLVLPPIVSAEPGSALALVIALLPLLPALWIAVAVARHVRRVDEFQRGLVLRSCAVGFSVAMLLAVAVALVGGAGIDTRHSEWIVFLGGMSAWGITLAISSMRADR